MYEHPESRYNFEREQEAERRAERAYEEDWLRRNGN